MTNVNGYTLYNAFGLIIKGNVTFPELNILETNNKVISDIDIQRQNLLDSWENNSIPNRYFSVRHDFCMFEVPNVAIFRIEEGTSISYFPYPNAPSDQIRLYLLGTCMGAILLQRKILPLHGSAVAIGGKVYAVVGDSGAGKSTLASAFIMRGYQLLSDDVIAVSFNEENTPIVTPSYPQQKLWQESIDQFGMDSTHYKPVIQRETKFTVPVKDSFHSEPLPLAGVIELTKKETGSIEINPVESLERLHKLFYHTYRNFIVPRSGLMEWHFETTAKLANKIDFYQIKRPITKFTAHELVDIILEKVQKGEKVL